MKTVELFAGIGGFRLAAEDCNLETVWANDIDERAVEVYKDNFGEDAMVQGDINDWINQIIEQMDNVLENYRKTGNLKQASIDSNINPNQTQQWLEWGENGFNESSTYFYNKIREIEDYFKKEELKKLKDQMEGVVNYYNETNSLKEASRLAGVSYDTVQYWFEWGSRGFGEENTYFFKKINENGGLDAKR